MGNNRDIPMESVENSAYLLSCRCPACGAHMSRGYDEETKFCSKCGQKVHMKAFSKEEVKQALFDNEMDDYED